MVDAAQAFHNADSFKRNILTSKQTTLMNTSSFSPQPPSGTPKELRDCQPFGGDLVFAGSFAK